MIIFRENKTGIVKNIVLNEPLDRPDLKGEYGIAVDIGTTTVAVGLFDLSDGKCLGTMSEKNRQCSLGSDVIMRMMHACNGRLNELQGMVVSQIEDMALMLCEGVCGADCICGISVVGNTAMCHIFLGKDVAGLSKAPFIPSYKGSVSCFGKDCGFKAFHGAKVYVMSGVAAHVGADAVSFFCTCGVADKDKNTLAIDIGTNAEIMLSSSGVGYVCSAAAGPAFEGMGISCGMPARLGAVSGVKISRVSGNIILDIIGGQHEKRAGGSYDKDRHYNADELYDKTKPRMGTPKGLCGSGLVDLIAELKKQGFIYEDGYLCGKDDMENVNIFENFKDHFDMRNGERCFVLCGEGVSSKEIYLCQSDIRNFQMAKAAIQAGANCLMSEACIGLKDLDEVIIGGMFGSYISKKSAVLLGLFPDIEHEKMSVCGNLAGTGAAKALLNEGFREETERVAGQIKHVELAESKEFESGFMAAMKLREWA